jgi:hypothetical protein
MSGRSSRPDVRNPMTKIPEVLALRELDPVARQAVVAAFRGISRVAHTQGTQLWAKNKYHSAAYWKAKGVDFRHLALAVRKPTT